MNKETDDFMKLHAAALEKLKMERGKLCLDVRTRNNLSRELVADLSGVSDRSIAKIELNYNTSIDLVNALYNYYGKQGYISKEEQERSSIGRFITCLPKTNKPSQSDT